MQTVFRSSLNPWRRVAALVILAAVLLSPGWAQAGVNFAAGEAASSPTGRVPAVVYAGADRHIYEIVLTGTWKDRDLTAAAAGAPLAIAGVQHVIAYRRGDGVSMVVYRGADAHIHALYLELARQGNSWQETWRWADLTTITGAPHTGFDPYGYVRSDGIATVVFTGVDGDIHELRLDNGWRWADLTAISGAPWPVSRPTAYVRGDGINAILYEDSNNNIIELRLEDGWEWADLTAISGAPVPLLELSAYVRSDGISTINYSGYPNGHLQDIRLETSWIVSDLTELAGAPSAPGLVTPHGYVRSDGINAVLHTVKDHIFEYRLEGSWKYYELTSIANAVDGNGPMGYVRADGVTAVVYRGINLHIAEFWLDNAWHWADLSLIAGAPDAASYPWAYNRSALSSIYMPIMRR